MATALVQIARGEREHNGRTGPKAAFEFFQGLSVPTVADRQREVREAGNKKAQFNAFCAIYGDQFGKVNGNGAVRSSEQVEEVRDNGVVAELRAFAKKLGLNVTIQSDEDDEPVVEMPSERTIPTPTRISWPMAMALKKIATKSGKSFEITGKSGGADTGERANYAIKFDGRKLTADRASEIIGAAKA